MCYDIPKLAQIWADRYAEGAAPLERDRVKYNFISEAFNVTTIAMVISLATAIFLNSTTFALFGAALYLIRDAFREHLFSVETAPPVVYLKMLNFIALIDPKPAIAEVHV